MTSPVAIAIGFFIGTVVCIAAAFAILNWPQPKDPRRDGDDETGTGLETLTPLDRYLLGDDF